jgi:hypothetical protein
VFGEKGNLLSTGTEKRKTARGERNVTRRSAAGENNLVGKYFAEPEYSAAASQQEMEKPLAAGMKHYNSSHEKTKDLRGVFIPCVIYLNVNCGI